MSPRRKNARQLVPTASQSKGHDDLKASGSVAQLNVINDEHTRTTTRSLTKRAILQDTTPQFEKGGGGTKSGNNLRKLV